MKPFILFECNDILSYIQVKKKKSYIMKTSWQEFDMIQLLLLYFSEKRGTFLHRYLQVAGTETCDASRCYVHDGEWTGICHSQTFRDQSKQNSTTLAQYIWRKQLRPNPNIKWEILKTSETYRPGQKHVIYA